MSDNLCGNEDLVHGNVLIDELNDIYAANYQGLLSYAMFLIHNLDDAQDLVQQAYEKIHLRILHGEGKVAEVKLGYIKTAILNLVRNQSRDKDSQQAKHELLACEPFEREQDITGMRREAKRKLILQATMAAVDRMPAAMGVVYALRYVCDLTQQQTAEILGIPLGTVQSRGSRSKQLVLKDSLLRAELSVFKDD